MNINELTAALESGDDLMTVMKSLGLDCLQREQEVRNDRYLFLADTVIELRRISAIESRSMWDLDGAAREPLTDALREQLLKAQATPALATLAVLEGICLGAANLFFANASSIVRLDRGLPVPLPHRWLPSVKNSSPHPSTTHQNLLAKDCNFVLWDEKWSLELDYTFRDRLDHVCAIRTPELDKHAPDGESTTLAYALPKIATIHPFNGDEMAQPEKIEQGRFFGVHPKVPPAGGAADVHQKVFDALAAVSGVAPIAIVPEFCMISPDGLDDLLHTSTALLPDLVVAGSAHTGGQSSAMRANTSHVLLDRHPILSVSKYQPFVLRLPVGTVHYTFVEDIAPVPRVLRLAAGTATRLAIAICSDLNSAEMVATMAAACVNLLFVPSWTPRIGVFGAALTQLAGYSQCVGVVANTPGHVVAEKPPFWACTATPRENDPAEIHYFAGGSTPAAGILDPNLDKTNPGHWTWHV